ncbi:MAG: trigger factor [Bacilli bacterium]|nr:trigger factor [Bacilli bacterium]
MANTKENKKKETKDNIHEISIKIEGKEWTDALDEAFKKEQKKVNVDGFRKGKVPRNIYEKKFGKESLFIPAAEEVLQTAYEKMMTESNLVPVVQPSVDIKDITDKYVEFTFKVITKPVVNVKKYKGLNIKPEKIKVTKEEIDHQIGHLLEDYTELVIKDGKVENGNVAVIDFEGFKDGVAFDGGKGENYSLEIGSNTFIPGFEEQLIGMKSGEEKDIHVVFPEDYGVEDLKAKPVVFKVKVNEIKEKVSRELDKEFFEDLAIEGVDSKEKLEKHIEEEIKASKEAENENKYVDTILEEVAKNVEVDIPQEMVDEETDRLMKRFEQQMAMQGLSLDVYYQFTKSSEKELREQMDKEAYKNVLYRLMLEEIMNIEKVEVSEEEANKEAEKIAKEYKMEKDEFLKQFGGIEMIQYDLEMRKVIEKLKELNK